MPERRARAQDDPRLAEYRLYTPPLEQRLAACAQIIADPRSDAGVLAAIGRRAEVDSHTGRARALDSRLTDDVRMLAKR